MGGRGKAFADSRIHEVEEEQADDPVGMAPGQRLRDRRAHVVRHDPDRSDSECVEQPDEILRLLGRPERPFRLVAAAEAAQIGRDQVEAVCQAGHHRFPGQPELRPAMKEKQRPPPPGARDM